MPPSPDVDDQEVMDIIGALLRAGVILAAILLIIGGTVYLVRHGQEPVPDRHHFEREPAEYTQIRAILRSALEGHGRPMIQIGLIILIATPMLRVVYTVVAYARRRDRLFTLLPLFVIVLVLLGFFLVPPAR